MSRVVIHSCKENDERQQVLDWCESAFGNGGGKWYSRSNYRDEGTFELIFSDQAAANLYMLRWGGKILDIEYQENFQLKVDPEAFEQLFEIQE